MLNELSADARERPRGTRRVFRFEYASIPMLVTLIRGARAVGFPSLYEGFGLPVVEAMQLGPPVGTSSTSCVPEIARGVVFPSLCGGCGVPVVEAMQLGTPVVTSSTSSLPEIAGDAALYVNPYDTFQIAQAIRTISADEGLRAELSRR